MTRNRPIGAWIRPLAALTAVLGMFILGWLRRRQRRPQQSLRSRYRRPRAAVGPAASATVYPGTPATLTISGGNPPYRAFSSNPAVLPGGRQFVAGDKVVLVANPIEANVDAAMTIQDAAGRRSRSPSPSARRRCSAGSGRRPAPPSAAARTSARADGHRVGDGQGRGRRAARRPADQVRRRVRTVAIQSTNPATPLVQTLTVVTDTNGAARVGLRPTSTRRHSRRRSARPTSPPASAVIGNFTVVNNTRPSAITIVPAKATITSFYKDECAPGSRSTTTSTAAIRRTACRRPSRRRSTCSTRPSRKRRLLPGGHQRLLRRPADVHGRRRRRQADDGTARERPGPPRRRRR